MRERFLRFVEHTLKWEGGDTTDTGGRTRFGISVNAYPDIDIASLTRDNAIELYYRDYYQVGAVYVQCDDVALKYFDLSVNVGIAGATRLLQLSANRLKFVAPAWPELTIDGKFGPKSQTRVNLCGPSLYPWLIIEASIRYNQLAQSRRYREYYLGWMNRLLDMEGT